MFIRRTATGNKTTGERYFTYRLVSSARSGDKVKQLTLLNLGRHFPLAAENWPLLCCRIEEIIGRQSMLLPTILSDTMEKMAQRYAAQILARTPQRSELIVAQATTEKAEQPARTESITNVLPEAYEVYVDSLNMLRPRSVGIENAGLHAMKKLGLIEIIKNECGLSGNMLNSAIGNIIGRMAAPGSERATWDWLQSTSSLGELLDLDFEGLSHMMLYRASDALIKHKSKIEAALYRNIESLFTVDATISLYDLTNTYFEGSAEGFSKAGRGRSKEKRSDCPLVTLGLVIDGSGFIKKSKVFAGNVSEAGTLETMLEGLKAPAGAMIIMDRGIATQANLDWLAANGYRYLVCKRGGERRFDANQAVTVMSQNEDAIRIHKTVSEDGKKVDLYCHSPGREQKEVAINQRFIKRFEEALAKLAKSVTKGTKNLQIINQRIGRLKEKSHGVSQHYDITVEADSAGKLASAITWKQLPVNGGSLTHPGVYCLSTNETSWDEEKLWRTYMTLTDLESVFRSLKSELGLRPIYHQKDKRIEGHLFITVLAYSCVQMLRTTLKEKNISQSWSILRKTLSIQRRITASFCAKDGRTVNIRKATLPDQELRKIYEILDINTNPGGIKKIVT
jgi:transposase